MPPDFEARARELVYGVLCDWDAGHEGDRQAIDALVTAFRAVRREALEEAAKRIEGAYLTTTVIGPLYNGGWNAAIDWAPKVIRTLLAEPERKFLPRS